MLNEKLDRIFENIDPNTDKAIWSRFCEWVNSFHEIDISKLVRFNNFSAFEKNGESELSLKYLESIKDLWVKWNRAVEADIADISI